MAELLKLEKDVPAVISLAYAQGKIVESTIDGAPNQVMFSLVDGRRTFLPLIAADRIREAGVQAHIPFEITKLGPAKFRIRNIGVSRDYTPELEASLAQQNARRSSAGAPEPSNTPAAATQYSSNGSAPAAPPQALNAKTNAATACMMAAMCSAVDAIIETQAYATRKGIGLTFSEESVRAIGLSIYIDACRNGSAR